MDINLFKLHDFLSLQTISKLFLIKLQTKTIAESHEF